VGDERIQDVRFGGEPTKRLPAPPPTLDQFLTKLKWNIFLILEFLFFLFGSVVLALLMAYHTRELIRWLF